MVISGRKFTYCAGILCLFLIALNLNSCAPTKTYKEESLPPEKIAVIQGTLGMFLYSPGYIKSFDGLEVQSGKVETEPGEHEIVVFSTAYSLGSDPETLTIHVEAGHKYLVKGMWNNSKPKIWIEDAASGIVIAHNKQMGSVAPEAEESEPIDTMKISCSKPYLLEQDCSFWSGAARSIFIDGFEVSVAGSKDGKVVMVMDAHLFSNSRGNKHSQASNDSFQAVKKILNEENIEIIHVRPLRSFGNIDGYVLELAGDGYSILKKFSSKPKGKK